MCEGVVPNVFIAGKLHLVSKHTQRLIIFFSQAKSHILSLTELENDQSVINSRRKTFLASFCALLPIISMHSVPIEPFKMFLPQM